MKTTLKSIKLVGATLGAAILTLSSATPAVAKPLTKKDFLLFDASARDRARGEKRFTKVMQIVFGDQSLFERYWGQPGPKAEQRFDFKGKQGSISFRSVGDKDILELEFDPNARPGQNLLTMLVKNARCTLPGEEAETCQAEVSFGVRSRGKVRIEASGSNGVSYSSGSRDISTGNMIILANGSN